MTTIAPTDRTRIRRMPERQVVDRDALYALLDAELVCHVAACVDGRPLVVPMGYARDGDTLLLHMSTGAGTALRRGGELAISVMALDALVYAGTLFDSSMNYRSAVVYGVPEVVPDEEKDTALLRISERLMPGRSREVPPNLRRELAGTMVLRVPIEEVGMKQRSGDPSPGDRDGDAWMGLLPRTVGWGEPVTAAASATAVVPASVLAR